MIGSEETSTGHLSLVGRRAMAEACSAITQRCLDDIAQGEASGHPWLAAVLPSVLEADVTNEVVATRFLATLVAVGQKLMDPRPLPVASSAELFAFYLIRREAAPALAVTESPEQLEHLHGAIRSHDLALDQLELLYGADAAHWVEVTDQFEEWFEAQDEVYPVHPYVVGTEGWVRYREEWDEEASESGEGDERAE